jgi:hypothetical protein
MVYRNSSYEVIGEVTEAVHKHLLDRYDLGENPPRIEEDLKFVPKDREEVVYLYMYRASPNLNLNRPKNFRQAPLEVKGESFYHRPPVLMDLHYLICVHAKFRSDAERLMGWVLLTLNDAGRLIYRPRRFLLPDGRPVDSIGRDWDPENLDGGGLSLQVEKVSMAIVDDLSLGDAINLFTLHEAPYRPFLTYRARVALDGPLIPAETGTTIALGRPGGLGMVPTPPEPRGAATRKSGRITGSAPQLAPRRPPGPEPHDVKRGPDPETESNS